MLPRDERINVTRQRQRGFELLPVKGDNAGERAEVVIAFVETRLQADVLRLLRDEPGDFQQRFNAAARLDGVGAPVAGMRRYSRLSCPAWDFPPPANFPLIQSFVT
ncbi:MAG: hypothetical protein CHACPFDD_03236 [Phycisphaerae bacterium]|nr:hypothetical protein [Phycisphaerae bacterium]